MANKHNWNDYGMMNYLRSLPEGSQERREKYNLARSHGVNASHARRCRDWRLSKLERRFNLSISHDTV